MMMKTLATKTGVVQVNYIYDCMVISLVFNAKSPTSDTNAICHIGSRQLYFEWFS